MYGVGVSPPARARSLSQSRGHGKDEGEDVHVPASTAATSDPSQGSDGDDDALVQQVRDELLLHKCVWLEDTHTLRFYCRHPRAGEFINTVDHHGNTPLSLAHRLGHANVLHVLLSHKADPRVKTRRGWSALQEACLLKQEEVALDMYLHMVLLKQAEWEAKLPQLRLALERMPDFYLEIEWKIESWIPFVSSMAPSDVFKIWKKGRKLRFDSTFRGMHGASVQKGLMSFLFSGTSLFMVDHDQHVWWDAMAAFRNPDFESIRRQVQSMLARDLGRDEMNTDNVQFRAARTFWGTPKKLEMVGPYECREMEMNGLVFSSVTLNNVDPSEHCVEMPEFEEYFDQSNVSHTPEDDDVAGQRSAADPSAGADEEPAVADDGAEEAPAEDDGMTVTTNDVTATMWICDDFPLSVDDLVTVMDIVSPVSSDLAKLNDFFGLQLPGFPVKLVIPVLPAVSASVTFQTYEHSVDIDDRQFAIPEDFQHT